MRRVLLICLLLGGWGLYPDDDVFYRISDAQNVWLQPAELDGQYPEYLSSRQWSFDFDVVEEKLSAVPVDGQGNLVISSQTPEFLQKILTSLDPQLSDENRQRAFFLMEKSVGGAAGMQLADLALRYSQYIKQLDQLKQEANSVLAAMHAEGSDLSRDEMLHQQSLVLQHQIFGLDITQAMFGRKQVLADYLFARRRIQADKALSDAEKSKHMEQLKKTYDASLKTYEARDNASKKVGQHKS